MKLKHFIFALVAMLSGFAFTANAQVAKVGNTEYATIDKAIANWTNGTTLTLLADVTLSDVVTLKSTEHHILDLGTKTMTAASGKNAFVIKACGTGDSERTAITIKADATNPGGINAGSKCVIYYKYADGGIEGNDRPIIKIEGGVFTGSTSSLGTAGIHTIGTAARKCATLNISGGTFNCTIKGVDKSKLLIFGGVFNYSVGSQGDSTALRLISGGKFKTLGFMTADSNNTKFWFGTSMANSNVGLYVDKDGYLVVGGPVITEVSAKYPAVASNATKWSSYLQYSSAAKYGLFYEDAAAAIQKHGAANVTIWEKPAVIIPENVTGDAAVVEEIKNNTALKGYTPSNLPEEADDFEIELKSVENNVFVFDVAPVVSGTKLEGITNQITFRLPVPASVTKAYAKVFHEETLMGIYEIKGEGNAKYVEVSSKEFSEYTVEPIDGVAKIGDTEYATLEAAAAAAQAGDVIILNTDATLSEKLTLPAGITLNGNGKQISGAEVWAGGNLTFVGHTKVTMFNAGYEKPFITIGEGACLELTGTGRMVIGHGATFNITGSVENAKTANVADLTPSLIMAGASFTGAGVNFNVTNAYIKATDYCSSKNSNANNTFKFNIENSIWEQTKSFVFTEPTNGKDPIFNLELKNSVLNSTSHLVFAVTKGEIVFDNSNVNVGKSNQIENRSNLIVKNGSVVNGSVATSSNAKNPGTLTVENAIYAVTGEFSGSDLGTGTLVIKKGANVSVGKITKANIVVDAAEMTEGELANFTANLANFAGELSVTNNDKLEAKIVNGKIVLAAKPVAKIGNTEYATLEAAFKAATSDCTIDILSDVTVDYNWDARNTGAKFTVPVTIIGNDKTIKFTASVNDNNYQAPFRFEADATVKGLTIDMSETTDSRFRAISSKGNLTVDGCTFIGKDATLNCRAIIFGEGAGANVGNLAIAITNSEFINWKRGITDNENAQDVKTVTITGNTLTNAGVGVSAKETVTFTGNTVAGAYVNIKSYTDGNKLAVTATGNTLEANTETAYNVINAGGGVQADGAFKVVAKGGKIIGYTGTDAIWGEVWGNARESFVIMVLDANDNVMGTTSLNNVGGIIDGDVNVSWNLKFNATANTDEYWTMSWTTAPSIDNMPAKVQLWVDGTKVSEGNVVLNGPDNLWPIAVAVTDENGVIKSCAQTLEAAVAAAQAGETVAILKAGTYALKVKNNITITGAVAGVEFANIGAFGCNGANVTFNNVTFTYASNSTYKGLQHSGNLVYNNCTFNGQVFLYGQSETFNNCTFNTTDSNNYNVWTYGAKEVAFNECTFNCAGKSVLIYSESATNTNNVTVTKSQFKASQAVEGKAAIEMDSSLSGAINLTIDGETTVEGFGNGNVSGNSLWNNKKGNNDLANNDITVKVGDTVVLAPIFEAQIGDVQYRNLQDAINAVQNDETITVLRDIAANVEIKEKDNVKVTIDGNGMKMTGTIKVVALSSDNDRRITIKNFKFEDTTSASVDFITSVETNHYPRITVERCTFTGSGDATDVALRLKSSKNVEIKNCTGKGLHSFLQNTSGWNLTIEDVTVTESKSALALGTVQGVTVKDCHLDVDGYGVRMDAGYNNNAVIESNTIKAFIPVVVRKASVDSNITVKGENTMNATNTDGLWCAIGTSEYETNGTMPTAATGKVVVALNDAALDSKGIYGNALAGQGTAEAPYLINNIGELVLFRNSVNAGETKYSAPGVHVALGADIDMTGINWVGIGSMTAEHGFMGNFDGKGFKIKNLTIDNPALDSDGYAYAGLFALTEGIDKANQNFVKNLVIENVTINTTGKIAAAAIAYAYYTIVDNVKVCGNIAITGGDYTAGVLAYTRRCVNASNLSIIGENNSFVKGAQVVGGVISDIQMNGGLKAEYSNFSAEGVTVSGTKNVGGISGIIATQTLNGASVKNVALECSDARVGIVAGCLGGTSTISNVTYENVAGATTLLGATYEGGAIEAKIDNTYYATLDAALAAEGEATVELFVPVTVATGESRVIELNGKTVIGTDNATGSFALININPEAELTINGEGAIKLTATNNRGWNAYSSVISNQRGKLTVNGGTIEHHGGTDMAYAIDNLTNTGAQNAETVINGGTVKSTYRAIRQFLNSTSAQNVLTVNRGTIEGANKSIWMQGANANANPGALTVEAAAAIKGDVYLTTAAGTAEYPVVVAVAADALKDGAQVLTSNVPADFAVANVNGTWTKVDAAASLNGKGYATLRAAVEAAQNGETVELLTDITLAGGYEEATEGLRIESEITLNGKNHTIDCGTFQKGIRIYNPENKENFKVTFNNVTVVNNVTNGRCIDTRSGNIVLRLSESTLTAENGNSQPLTIGGSDPIQAVTLSSVTINAGESGYGVINFVPANQHITTAGKTKITGYSAFYVKADGTKLNIGQGTETGGNNHSGSTNDFGTIVLESNSNTVNISGTNPFIYAIANGTAAQAAFLVLGENNTININPKEGKEGAIVTEGENAYWAMIAANTTNTKFTFKGDELSPVAEAAEFQFMSLEEAIRYAGNEGTIKVINNCALNESWTVAAGQNITLDLNGKTVAMEDASAATIAMIKNNGNLTITDSSDAKDGKLSFKSTTPSANNGYASNAISNHGTFTMEAGTIENLSTGGACYALDNYAGSTATIKGGKLTAEKTAVRIFNWTDGEAAKATLNVTGGEIYSKDGYGININSGNAPYVALNICGGTITTDDEDYNLAVYVVNKGTAENFTAEVTGGTFNGLFALNGVTCTTMAAGAVSVSGGTFDGVLCYGEPTNGFISGGTFNSAIDAAYCAEGYMPTANGNGTYGVVRADAVYASINGHCYESLAAAVNAAKAGETITLLQNVKENVTISKNLTIDGADNTITGMITTDGKSLKVTIKNAKFDGNNKTINYALRADDDLNLVVENCTVNNYIYGFLYANKSNDKIVVKNVTVENCAEYGAYLVSFNKATFENFVVKGATKYGIAVANAGARNVTLKNVSFENAETPLSINEIGTGKVTFTFEGENEMSKEVLYTSEYVKLASAVQVGTKVYGNFAEAVASAQDGQTVKLLSDFNLGWNDVVSNKDGQKVLANVDGKNITLDMNGKKIAVDHRTTEKTERIYSVICVEDGAGLTVTGNGSIDVTTGITGNVMPKVAYMFWKRGTTGYLVIENGYYHMDNSEDSMVYANGGNIVTVEGGTFILDANGKRDNGFPWIFNVAGNNAEGAYINVTGGTYNYDIRKQFWSQEVKLAEGLTMKDNRNGTWTVTEAVASVGEESYGSIQEAIEAAETGETVTLLKDVAYTDADAFDVEEKPYSTMLYVQDKNITLDLNGKNIDVAYTGSLLYSVVLVSDGAGLTVTGEGSINAQGLKADGTAAKNIAYVFWKRGTTGYLVIENGTFHLNDAADSMVYTNGHENVTINGGTFILDAVASQANGWPVIFNTAGNHEKHIVVNGGTFNYDITHQMRPFEVYVAPVNALKKVQIDGVDMWSIVEAQAYVTEMLGDFVTESGDRELKVGYETVAEAIKVAKANETVTILAGEFTGNLNVNKGITVQGETDEEGNNLVTFNGKLSISADGATVKNINFNNASGNAGYISAKDVVVENCQIVGSNGFRNCYTSGTVTFKNSYIKGGTYGIHFDGKAGGNIVIENCTVIGWNSFASTIESVTISGTEFAEGNYNQLRLYQNATITDCTFNEKMNIDWGSSNKTAEFTDCSVEGDKELTDVISLANIVTKSLEVTVDGELICVAAEVDNKYYLSLQEAIDAATEDQTVTVVSDLALTEGVTVAVDKKISIALSGKTITGTPAEAKAYAVITNKGTLTIVGEGAIVCNHTLAGSTSYAVNTIVNSGNLTIDGATIENKSTASNQIGYAIDNNSTSANASVTIVSGNVTVSGSNYYDGIRQFCNSTTAMNDVIVSGGNVSSIWMQNPSDGATRNTKDVNGSVTIIGGEVSALYLEPSANFEADITGGHVGSVSYFEHAEVASRNLVQFVTGGTFGTLIDETFLALGYQLTGEGAPYTVAWTGYRENFVINDADGIDYVNDNDIIVGTLTYNRTLPLNIWAPLYVPFELPMSAEFLANYDIAYFNDVHGYGENDAVENTRQSIELIKVTNPNAKLKANFPLVIRAKNETAQNLVLTFNNATLYKDVVTTITMQSASTTYMIEGSYTKRTELEDNQRVLGLDYETYQPNWGTLAEGYSLNPYRLILTIESRTGNLPFLMSIGMRVIGEDAADGSTIIYGVENDADSKVDYIYDLQGRRVQDPQKGGLYLINGKKTILK